MKLPLLSVVALALAACQTPLAPTNFPIKEIPTLEGRWTLTLDHDEDSEPWFLEIERLANPPRNSLERVLSTQPYQDAPARYRATLRPLVKATDPAAEEIVFDGQIIERGEHDYCTFQRTTEAPSWPLYLFEVPLQNTLRIEHEDDAFRLLLHPSRSLWVPVALAGEMKLGPPARASDEEPAQGAEPTFNPFGVLMSDLDAVLNAYAATRDEDWSRLLTAQRAL